MGAESLRILALEPYYSRRQGGGSHPAFLDGWSSRSRHDFTLLTLPASKWKWRMRQSAPRFAAEVAERVVVGEEWDRVWASDMLGLAEFRGLAPRQVAELPTVLYFHENQLTYPVRFERERDWHFGLTNLTSALAADRVWFNSGYHRDDLLAAIPDFLKPMPDFRSTDWPQRIAARSEVQSPGVSVDVEPEQSTGPLRIAWAARWEHDKGPAVFFAALDRLVERGVDFELAVMGETFRESPDVFGEARERLADRIVAWGFQESRSEYEAQLARADVFVSTAEHEFFGLAAVEAGLAGCVALLPQALSYPEVFADAATGESVLFHAGDPGSIADSLVDLAQHKRRQGTLQASCRAGEGLERYRWRQRAAELDDAMVAVGC